MKNTAPMGTTAQHEAVLHTSPADLARRVAPRVGAALAAGDMVVAVLGADHQDALRAELGAVADSVEFADPVLVHDVPAFTVAVRWARRARAAAAVGRQVLVVGGTVDGLPGCGPEHWARLDIALNVALVGLPASVLCAYPADSLDLARVHRMHPLVSTVDGSASSTQYRPPHEALIEFPPPPAPDLGTPTAELAFRSGGLPAVRRLVGAAAREHGLDVDRVADLVLVVNELAANSMEHGPGSGTLRLWRVPPTALLAEVSDAGGGIDLPFPGITLPPPDGARGRGLWLASELSDVMQVWSDDRGTVIRVQVR